jgi:polysaccharide export outer membrane protein
LNQRLNFLPIQDKNLELGIMKIVKIFSILLVLVFSANYSVSQLFAQGTGNTKPTEKNDLATERKATQPENEKNDELTAQKNTNPIDNQNSYKDTNNERYPIGFLDSVEVTVIKHPELSQVVAINRDGTIFMPRIDQPIMAVCKTESELKDTITALYKSHLRNPFVNVRLIEQKSQAVAVMGAVKKPGSFYLTRKMRLLELLSLAGGYDVEFAGVNVKVARVGNLDGCPTSQDEKEDVVFLSYNLKDVIEGKENPWMQPGDIVTVLEAAEVYVVGNVIEPSRISLKESYSLTQAIAKAGGMKTTANTTKVVIQRQEKNSLAKTELVFNLKDIWDKKVQDPILQANDIVVVGTDTGKSLKKGMLKILTNGLPSVFLRVPLP